MSPAAGATQVREEADLAAESMRSLVPCTGLPCFRQGHGHVESSTTLHKATPAAEQIEFFHWTLWIHNPCHHRNSNQG